MQNSSAQEGINQSRGPKGLHSVLTYSAEETFELGKRLGASLPDTAVVCFFGDLAAGKTTLIKGLVAGVSDYPSDQISSPTFVLMNIYDGNKKVYHFDLYRLKGEDEFLSLGFDEYWQLPGICCIEWSERIASILPSGAIKIKMEALGENTRRVEIS